MGWITSAADIRPACDSAAAIRRIIRRTVCACLFAPLGVGMPRAASCAAICRANKPAQCPHRFCCAPPRWSNSCWLCQLLALSWRNLPCALKAAIGNGKRTLASPAVPAACGGHRTRGKANFGTPHRGPHRRPSTKPKRQGRDWGGGAGVVRARWRPGRMRRRSWLMAVCRGAWWRSS